MSFDTNKPYNVGTSYWNRSSFSSLESALEEARTLAASERNDVPVFKAVSIVKFPKQEASDLKVEKLS